ncbi:DUF6982 domain-containing protein [Silvibacterium dinghuense]|uniref:Uncharacterized protein n=1 Tax=Silvibacterium dinghuense TaxID=1560006 RepID=A0A4Q1SDW0_9BACT|nr:hypothetical protein [Silvibacterium dinghuense]RXS95265.1 hypothetical protein ESZ00_11755 [Silvibacterium dinghuense]GGH11969.1 hypothetical protein GCM10011586_30950 [Silvibacterium dinghuense]
MSSSRKKVIVRKLSRDWVPGYLPADGFVRGGSVELLGLDGKVAFIDVTQVKWIAFVRDFNSGETANPERLLRKTFTGRPRTSGIFLRLRLTDGELLEGVAANDSSLIASHGVFLTPPDTRSNTQRLWVPAGAVSELEAISVIGNAAKPKPASSQALETSTSAQEELF